jgi:hypothetical protein
MQRKTKKKIFFIYVQLEKFAFFFLFTLEKVTTIKKKD